MALNPQTTELVAERALARLVRDEYPAGYSLAEIAQTWGNATEDEIKAVRHLEAVLGRQTSREPS